jgi:hypothetical protein
MHEDRVLLGALHQAVVDLIGPQQVVAGALVVVAHRDPAIGDDAIGALDRFLGTMVSLILAPCFLAQAIRAGGGASSSGVATDNFEIEPAGGVDPGGQHVVGVAGPGDALALDRALALLEGHDVGHDLAGMLALGQAVDHRDGGVFRHLDQRSWSRMRIMIAST